MNTRECLAPYDTMFLQNSRRIGIEQVDKTNFCVRSVGNPSIQADFSGTEPTTTIIEYFDMLRRRWGAACGAACSNEPEVAGGCSLDHPVIR